MTHGEGQQGRFVLAIGSSEPISNLELPRGNVRRLQDLLQLGGAGGTTTPSANPGAGAGATECSPAAPEGAFQRQLKVKPQAAKRAKTTLKADGNRKSPVWAGSTAGARGLEGSEVAVNALLLAPDSGSHPVVGRKRGGRARHCSWHHGGLILAPSPSHALEDASPLRVGAALTRSVHNHPASGTKPRCQRLRFPVPMQTVTPSRAGNAGGFQGCCPPPSGGAVGCGCEQPPAEGAQPSAEQRWARSTSRLLSFVWQPAAGGAARRPWVAAVICSQK